LREPHPAERLKVVPALCTRQQRVSKQVHDSFIAQP
jgi:hypothetical protein